MSFKSIPFWSMNQTISATGGTSSPSYPSFDINYIYCGGLNDGGGDTFRKVNLSGSLQWEKQPFGSGQRVNDLSISPYNNIYLCGLNTGSSQLVKTDMDGVTDWSVVVGSDMLACSVDTDENIWVVGLTGSDNGILHKYDSDGNHLTQATTNDYAICAQTDTDNNLYVGCHNANDSKTLIKLDSDGNELWDYNHGGRINAVAVPLSGTYVVAGGERVSNVVWRKFDSDGNLEYSRDFTNRIGVYSRGIFVDNLNEHIYVTVESSPNVRKYDADGTLLWTKAMPCSICRAYGIIPDATTQSYFYTAQQQEGLKKWTNVSSPVQQWQYDAGSDYAIRTISQTPLPYGINQDSWV